MGNNSLFVLLFLISLVSCQACNSTETPAQFCTVVNGGGVQFCSNSNFTACNATWCTKGYVLAQDTSNYLLNCQEVPEETNTQLIVISVILALLALSAVPVFIAIFILGFRGYKQRQQLRVNMRESERLVA